VLGSSEHAARKRVSRALEKLRVFLVRHGVVLSAAALSGLLVENTVQAAPAGLSTSSFAAITFKTGTTTPIALANGTMKTMLCAKLKTSSAVAVLVLALAGSGIVFGIAIRSNRQSHVARSPAGKIIKLERYAFERGTVRYESPNRPIARALSKALPASLNKKIKWLKPGVTSVIRPAFPNEPLLSAAFSSEDASGKLARGRVGTRLVVSDDRGQVFDSVVNYLGNFGVFEVNAFPRRGKQLTLHLMEDENLLAEFKIPNPCPGPHPRWKPGAIPVVLTNAGLEITVEEFTVDRDRLKTQCTFLIREDGKESMAWLPVAFEVSDATGNHWRPSGTRTSRTAPASGRVVASFLGALWPEEDAWKVRVEFKPTETDPKGNANWAIEFLAKPEQVKDGSKANWQRRPGN
jgi:hypothetical protein